jgi:hypothetical protein
MHVLKGLAPGAFSRGLSAIQNRKLSDSIQAQLTLPSFLVNLKPSQIEGVIIGHQVPEMSG